MMKNSSLERCMLGKKKKKKKWEGKQGASILFNKPFTQTSITTINLYTIRFHKSNVNHKIDSLNLTSSNSSSVCISNDSKGINKKIKIINK